MVIVLARSDTTSAGTFNPFLTVTLESTEPETSTTLTVDFGIESKDDVNFGGAVAFLPVESGIVNGDAIPIGEPVGELHAQATLGLINGACNTVLPVDFVLNNASIDTSNTVSFEDLEKDESKEGVDLNDDGEVSTATSDGFGTRDFAEDKDGNTLLDAIDHWPEFIERTLGYSSPPFRRSAGITPVAGTPVLLQFLIFDPGTTFDLQGEEFEKLIPTDEALGYMTFILLQNIGDPEIKPEPGVITDFCSPLQSQNVTYGTNLDADEDGTPNEEDTCPYDAHDLLGTHDADFDFLHSQCDENDDEDAGGRNEDQDDDGVENFADTCPLEPDPDQVDGDEDFIGDACDEDPANPDGVVQLSVLPQDGTYEFNVFTVGQRDVDGDKWQNSLDTCPYVENTGDPTITNDGDVDGDGLDAACDPNDDPLTGGASTDEDGDGYLNRQDNCPLEPNGENETDPVTGNQADPDLDSIGTLCDPEPETGDGELIQVTLNGEVVIGTGSGPGGPPSEEACPDCHQIGEVSSPGTDETPAPSDTSNDDSSSNTGLIIGIIVAAAAAIIIIGGGAALLLRRGGS
jgi:hypothetical protein